MTHTPTPNPIPGPTVVDVTAQAAGAGLNASVLMTRDVWHLLMGTSQSTSGTARGDLWEVLWFAARAAEDLQPGSLHTVFSVRLATPERTLVHLAISYLGVGESRLCLVISSPRGVVTSGAEHSRPPSLRSFPPGPVEVDALPEGDLRVAPECRRVDTSIS